MIRKLSVKLKYYCEGDKIWEKKIHYTKFKSKKTQWDWECGSDCGSVGVTAVAARV